MACSVLQETYVTHALAARSPSSPLTCACLCRNCPCPLPLRFRAQLGLQVAQGMSYLHSMQIVHFECAPSLQPAALLCKLRLKDCAVQSQSQP